MGRLFFVAPLAARLARNPLALLLAATCCSLLATETAWAQTDASVPIDTPSSNVAREETYETGRGLGMGTGSRASSTGTSALAYNSANMPLQRTYQIESSIRYVPSAKAFIVGGAIIDSTNQVSAGMSFRYIFGDKSRDYDGWDGRLALAIPFSDKIAVGISGRYLSVESNKTDSNGNRYGAEASGFTMDASIRLTLFDGLNVAALGYNFIDLGSELAPMMFGGGMSYGNESFSLGADVLADLSTFDKPGIIAGGGGEYLFGDSLPVRLGYRFDGGREVHQVTGSIGYVTPHYSTEISLRQDVSADQKQTQLIAGFRYYVER